MWPATRPPQNGSLIFPEAQGNECPLVSNSPQEPRILKDQPLQGKDMSDVRLVEPLELTHQPQRWGGCWKSPPCPQASDGS